MENINFSIGESQIMTVVGANGTGKTTLLNCTLGILKWDTGETRINGKTARNIQDYREAAYVPQAHRLSFPYTVKEMVLMGRNKRIGGLGSPSRQDNEKCDQALEMAGIGNLGNKICSKLSGGQLQLVFIARALAAEPELLILDEPESHLDLHNQFRILRLIKRMTAEKGISCIINTHYPDHALRISDTTLMLNSHE
ncbi:MAG: ABC transporter ATP-binding protein, partial [Treponema sp.]|nr:ABC transporter ATP-binding protein [Treponema sp.]